MTRQLPPIHDHSADAIAKRLQQAKTPSVLKDLVYGGIDGAVTTLAIVAGVQGAGFSHTVIIALGLANILADGFSMAAGNFAGTRAEAEDVARLRAIEADHIQRAPDGEREELHQILAAKGLSGAPLEQAVDAICSRESAWIDMMLVDEYGVSPLAPAPLRAALATFFAFLVAGFVPLLPYLLNLDDAFTVSLVMTFAVFVLIGALRGVWSLRSSWLTALETVIVGGIAAAIAYLVGGLFDA
ncbi:VIT1/CCC1 transporter family protein [uncultured Tateyamaria sp.]|uniref:VIT1/CCC1 transporter family protein n=1 Tax=uncultured Tateyamaria sp. TaxID=455651 RepID=UPI00262C5810|nr:VIT1/CCC1 transporter family protein [uncultured Tateyamaria sp.]